MKKLLSLIFALCFTLFAVFAVTSCGKEDTSESAEEPVKFSFTLVKDGDDTYYSLKSVTVSEEAQELISKKDYTALAELFNKSVGDYKAPETALTKETVRTLTIPAEYNNKAVKKIASDAVSALAFVEKIVVGDNIEEISEGAFSSLVSLKEIDLPFVGAKYNAKNEKKLFGYIFGTTSGDGLTACEQKYNDGDSDNTATYYLPASLKTVTVRRGNDLKTKTLNYKKDGDKYVFEGDDAYNELNAITLSTEVDASEYAVAPYSFYNCTTLEVVNLTNAEKIEDYTFYGCSGIKTLSFADETKTVGAHAYENCTSLKTVDFNKVEVIGEYAFASCTALGRDYTDSENEITISAEIGDNAFEGCTSLKKVTFGEGAKIGVRAFKGCTAIKGIDLTNVTALGEYAFYGCSNLETVTNLNGLTALHAFENTAIDE